MQSLTTIKKHVMPHIKVRLHLPCRALECGLLIKLGFSCFSVKFAFPHTGQVIYINRAFATGKFNVVQLLLPDCEHQNYHAIPLE